jgi:hypothetical protein
MKIVIRDSLSLEMLESLAQSFKSAIEKLSIG